MLQIAGHIHIGDADHSQPHPIVLDIIHQHLADFAPNHFRHPRDSPVCSHCLILQKCSRKAVKASAMKLD
jgi:hypothetical protein